LVEDALLDFLGRREPLDSPIEVNEMAVPSRKRLVRCAIEASIMAGFGTAPYS
jgi:hypothetical protein